MPRSSRTLCAHRHGASDFWGDRHIRSPARGLDRTLACWPSGWSGACRSSKSLPPAPPSSRIALGLLLLLSRETSVVALVITPLDSTHAPVDRMCPSRRVRYVVRTALGWLEEMLMHTVFFLDPRGWCHFLEVVRDRCRHLVAFRRGEYRITLQVTVLLGAALAIDTLEAARALRQDYFQFTDHCRGPLPIANISTLQYGRWTYPSARLRSLYTSLSVRLSRSSTL